MTRDLFGDLLAVAVLFFFAVMVYTKSSGKSLKEVIGELKDLLGFGQDE